MTYVVVIAAALFMCITATVRADSTDRVQSQVGIPDEVVPGKDTVIGYGILNVGSKAITEPITIEEKVSAGLTLAGLLEDYGLQTPYIPGADRTCSLEPHRMVCTFEFDAFPPGVALSGSYQQILVDSSAEGDQTVDFTVYSGDDPILHDTRVIHTQSIPYGIQEWKGSLSDGEGRSARRAGVAPAIFENELRPSISSLSLLSSRSSLAPREQLKQAVTQLPAGLVGNPGAVDTCSQADLSTPSRTELYVPSCPPSSQVGVFRGTLAGFGVSLPIYLIEPRPGAAAEFAFNFVGVNVLFEATLHPERYSIDVRNSNISTTLVLTSARLEIWGNPMSSDHDPVRGSCLATTGGGIVQNPGARGTLCPVDKSEGTFLRTPTSCSGRPLPVSVSVSTYQNPDRRLSARYDLPPLTACEEIPVKGTLHAQPTALDTETPSGLKVHVEVPNQGLENPDGVSSSDLKQVQVTLPKGMTVNPSQAEGLGACSVAQYESSRLEFNPDGLHGCPPDSKIGTVQVKTPLLEETIPGNVYIAQPFDNPFGTLLALYIVLEEPQRGILVKLPGRVDTDPSTGQITTTFSNLPQLPFSTLDFRFREGARAPLVTPQACGTYETVAEFIGHSAPNGPPVISKSSFQIVRGIGGGPCPSGGIPPFKPGLNAGTLNNQAGSYSPFNLRLFRTDAEQQFTNFSIKLPPGVTGKLAGIPFCPDAAIAAAKDPNRSGATELATPSCPAASQVGRTLVGAGVGPVQAYVPGKVYLAGPYNGSALSIASITAAKVGPFDLGTVVVRLALRVNPETAEVFVDPTGSDPLPHIIDGVPTKLRDIRAYVDRPEFVLNPTNCDPTSVASTVLGSGLDLTSPADDEPVTVTTRFQAANCASLGFKPKLGLRLFGGTKRGENPRLRAVLRMPKGNANIAKARVTLPHSAFLDQSHIRTVCTRVQFAKGPFPGAACPAGAVYGYARAITPLLDEPIQGPVFLRSSSNPLPDLVAALHSGRIDVNVVGRIDSVKGGQIRTTFQSVPDAPVSKFTLAMQGGKKGLLVNSTNICRGTHRASAEFDGHNGKAHDLKPVLKAKCPKAKKAKKGKRG